MSRMSRAPDRIPPGPIKLTYEDYVDLPDDGRRYEILDGELEVSPAPAPMHQGVSRNLLVILHGHVRERGLGSVYYAPIDVILANTTIAQPDLVFVVRAGSRSSANGESRGLPIWSSRSFPPGRFAGTAARKRSSTRASASPTTGSWMPRRGHSSSMRRGARSTGSSPRTRATRRCGPRSSPASPSTSAASGSEVRRYAPHATAWRA